MKMAEFKSLRSGDVVVTKGDTRLRIVYNGEHFARVANPSGLETRIDLESKAGRVLVRELVWEQPVVMSDLVHPKLAYLVAQDAYANNDLSWAPREEVEAALRLTLRALNLTIPGKAKGDEALRLLRLAAGAMEGGR